MARNVFKIFTENNPTPRTEQNIIFLTRSGRYSTNHLNPNPLAILAENLPQSAKIQHHAVTLPLLDLAGIGTPSPHIVWGYTVPSPSKSNKPCCWSLNGLGVVRVKYTQEFAHLQKVACAFCKKIECFFHTCLMTETFTHWLNVYLDLKTVTIPIQAVLLTLGFLCFILFVFQNVVRQQLVFF